MADTPQPATAGENAVTLEDGAAAFKAFLNPQPAATRDEAGRFASPNAETQPEVGEETEQAPASDDGDDTGGVDETEEAPDDTGQPDDVSMPASWGKDDEGLWQELPVEAQAKIAERETQRETAINSKFQESANIARAAQQQAAEANANRDYYAKATEQLIGFAGQLFPRPIPSQYGAGTGAFDQEGYLLANEQWEQIQANLSTLDQQRQNIAAQQERDELEANAMKMQAVESVAWPRFIADVPDLQTPKGQEVVNKLIQYGVDNGIDRSAFQPGEITSRELHILWKASEYDRIKAAKTRVAAGNPPPKPAGPVVRPGGVTSRQSVQAARLNKAQERLAKSGSVNDAAAVFKSLGF
jgi:hypothetical protein